MSKKVSKEKRDTKKLKKGDFLLLILYADRCSPIKGRTRLQKMIFIFEQEIYKKFGFNKNLEKKVASPFEFKAHNFGPFSAKIFEMMDFFININMAEVKCDVSQDIEEAVSSIDDEDIYFDDLSELILDDEEEIDYCREPEYRITEQGKKYVEQEIVTYLSNEQIEAVTKLKQNFNNYSLNKILKYVYIKYPDMTKESQIKNKVLG